MYAGLQQVEDLLKKVGEHSRLHVAKDLNNLIKLSGVYLKYCLAAAQEKGAEVCINMNLIEDA
jgi:hypothetical protein